LLARAALSYRALCRLVSSAQLAGTKGAPRGTLDRPDNPDLQDVLVCIRHRVPLAAARPYLRPGASWHLRSAGEMARRFADLPAALRGTATLAGRCGFALDHVDAALPLPGAPTHALAPRADVAGGHVPLCDHHARLRENADREKN
jgi:DNA polymerase III alpha subunit